MKNLVIAVAGNSGSGKTTFCKFLSRSIKEKSVILECDRYHKWERGDKKWEKFTHLNPVANNLHQMSKDVKSLTRGNTIYQINYDHSNGKFTDKEKIESQDFVIVCGLPSFFHEKEEPYFLKIFMDTAEELQVPWKMNRDKKKRGYTYIQVMEEIKRRKKDYDEHVFPQKAMADLSIKFIKNKKNKMSYSLFLEIDNKFDFQKIQKKFEQQNIQFELCEKKQKYVLFFENYVEIEEIKIYNNFYDYILFFMEGLIDGEY